MLSASARSIAVTVEQCTIRRKLCQIRQVQRSRQKYASIEHRRRPAMDPPVVFLLSGFVQDRQSSPGSLAWSKPTEGRLVRCVGDDLEPRELQQLLMPL